MIRGSFPPDPVICWFCWELIEDPFFANFFLLVKGPSEELPRTKMQLWCLHGTVKRELFEEGGAFCCCCECYLIVYGWTELWEPNKFLLFLSYFFLLPVGWSDNFELSFKALVLGILGLQSFRHKDAFPTPPTPIKRSSACLRTCSLWKPMPSLITKIIMCIRGHPIYLQQAGQFHLSTPGHLCVSQRWRLFKRDEVRQPEGKIISQGHRQDLKHHLYHRMKD